MAPPPSSSLLRDLLAADGFKNRQKPPDTSAPAASRAVSMPLHQQRRPAPGRPARSQSDVLTSGRPRDGGDGAKDGSRDAGARRAATATRGSSASMTSARDGGSNKGNGDTGVAKRSPAPPTAIPALDESALNAVISLAAGTVKRFLKDDAFRASLRAGCASCLGDSDHRAVLDLRVLAQTVERAATEGLDPRDLKRASVKLHEIASLGPKDAAAVTAAGVPYQSLAACAHLYMSVVSKLQKKDHSAAVHALEVFCLVPREARTALLPALWDRLLRPGLSHLREWRARELSAASSNDRVKEVEKMFVDAVDDGTRVLACYYRDWLLGRTDAMALPDVPAPPSTVHVVASSPRFSVSTSYGIGSDAVFSSDGLSPARSMHDTMRQSEEVDGEEELVNVKAADAESVFHEHNGIEASSYTPKPQPAENVQPLVKLAKETFEQLVEDEPSKEPGASTSYPSIVKTSYPSISDISAVDLLTLEFCEGTLQSDTDGTQASIFSTVPDDFLCPLTRQIFNHPVTIETGQTFERHAVVKWFDKGLRVCPVTDQELESLSVPDTNRVLKRLIDSWKSEHCDCDYLISQNIKLEGMLSVAVIDKVLSSARDMSEKLGKARHLMAVGGIDFLLRVVRGGEDEKVRAAEHLLLCIRAEGSCRNYVATKLDSSSVLWLLHNDVLSARGTAVCLLLELLCLRRREMFELLLHGLRTESIVEATDVVLEHLRSLPVEEQAPVAVLLLRLDALLETHHHQNSMYREEAAKIITESLRCCLSEEHVVPNARRALLLLGGHFSFSGDLLAEDWMLKQAGFVDGSRGVPFNSDAAAQPQDKDAGESEAWLRHVTSAFLGGSGRKQFLDALSKCLNSPDGDLAAACLTTAGWLSRSLASMDATDMQLAAFSALVPRLKRCLAAARPARHRVLAVVSLHNFSKIPDCRAMLMLLADGLRDDIRDLAGMTRTAYQLSAELQE